MEKDQHWMAQDVTIIKVPEVCWASFVLQITPRIIFSCELFWVTNLDVLELVHPSPMFSMPPFCTSPSALAPTKAKIRAACCSATCCRVPDATTPRATLQSRGPSTSPCSAPRSFGVGLALSCSTAACLEGRLLAEFLTALHTIIQKQFCSSTLIRAKGVSSDRDIRLSKSGLVEDRQSLSSSWRAHSNLPECSDFSLTVRQEPPRHILSHEVSHLHGSLFFGVHALSGMSDVTASASVRDRIHSSSSNILVELRVDETTFFWEAPCSQSTLL